MDENKSEDELFEKMIMIYHQILKLVNYHENRVSWKVNEDVDIVVKEKKDDQYL